MGRVVTAVKPIMAIRESTTLPAWHEDAPTSLNAELRDASSVPEIAGFPSRWISASEIHGIRRASTRASSDLACGHSRVGNVREARDRPVARDRRHARKARVLPIRRLSAQASGTLARAEVPRENFEKLLAGTTCFVSVGARCLEHAQFCGKPALLFQSRGSANSYSARLDQLVRGESEPADVPTA